MSVSVRQAFRGLEHLLSWLADRRWIGYSLVHVVSPRGTDGRIERIVGLERTVDT